MCKPPAFQFYAADFVQGTLAMDVASVGAYIRLLCYQWTSGGVPSEPEKMARICGVSVEAFGPIWSEIADRFESCEDGMLRNARLERTRREQVEARKRRSEAGKRGGRPRKALDKQCFTDAFVLDKQSESNGKAEGKALESSSSSSSVSTSIDPPPPPKPPSASTAGSAGNGRAGNGGGGGFSGDWAHLVSHLKTLGVADAHRAVGAARSNGVPVEELQDVARYWSEVPGRWGPQALHWRISNATPGRRSHEDWPPSATHNPDAERERKRRVLKAKSSHAYQIIREGRRTQKPEEEIEAELQAAGLQWSDMQFV